MFISFQGKKSFVNNITCYIIQKFKTKKGKAPFTNIYFILVRVVENTDIQIFNII